MKSKFYILARGRMFVNWDVGQIHDCLFRNIVVLVILFASKVTNRNLEP